MIFDNDIIIAAFTAWFIAQAIKIIINLISNKTLNLGLITSSGGMPSSHTSTVIAMTTSVGIIEGIDSTFFAIACILSVIVMYDALGVRRQAGKHAQIINILTKDTDNSTKLKELVGHKPIEVLCGAILGILVAYILTVI